MISLTRSRFLVGGVDLSKGFRLAHFVAGDAGRLLDENPPFIRSGVGNGTDVPLLNNGVGAGTHAAAHEDIMDVFQPAGLLVDQITGFPPLR
jgi:hypothetical protein